MLNESLVKYLAGLLDADGSLSFNFKRDPNRPGRCFVGLNLHLTASDAVDKHGFVEGLPELTGMGVVTRYGANDQFAKWVVSKRADVEMLVPRLTKHMVIKARHWQWLLETWRDRRANGATVSDQERDELTAASKESRATRVGPLRPKNHPTWAWVAGYLDGDGCYNYRRHYAKTTGYYQWSISVTAVAHVGDASVLEFLERSFGGSVRQAAPTMKVWRRALGYNSRSFAERFLPKVAKHSRLKRHKIDAIIHHHRQRLSVPGTERHYCTMDGCGERAHGNGLCSKHYQRQRKLEKVQAIV